MPYSWAPEALKAQAVAARSYALATRKVAAPFDLYPDTRSQMYLGIAHEQTSTNAAVDATAGQVLLFDGQVARTFFFSTSGGRTANATDVWAGGQSTPYLVSVPDPYDVISPYHDWGPFTFTGAALARTFRVPGAVTDIRTALNQSGRVSALSLLGTKGQVDVPAATVRSTLKLRSTWFDIGVLALLKPTLPAPIEYGGSVQLSGVVRGLASVALEQRPAGATWQAVGPVAPGKDGSVAVVAKPNVTTDYRLATSSVAAAPVRVPVAPRVRFYADKAPGTLRGLVRPVLAGVEVKIQLQDDTGAWTAVATTSVDANGDFVATLELAPGVYRARVAASKGFAAGTTPPLRVVSG